MAKNLAWIVTALALSACNPLTDLDSWYYAYWLGCVDTRTSLGHPLEHSIERCTFTVDAAIDVDYWSNPHHPAWRGYDELREDGKD